MACHEDDEVLWSSTYRHPTGEHRIEVAVGVNPNGRGKFLAVRKVGITDGRENRIASINIRAHECTEFVEAIQFAAAEVEGEQRQWEARNGRR